MPIYRLNFQKRKSVYYDTDRGTFYELEGYPIVFNTDLDVPRRATIEPYGNGERIKKSRNPRKVRIVMGFDCNFKCKYCSQKITREDSAERMFGLTDSFLERFQLAIDTPPRSIEFWGGEPLVYIKTLRKIVPKLREQYPSTTFRIITNGSLITDDVVDFLLKYGIITIVSHDAQGQCYRGEDPLADPQKKAALKRLYEGLKTAPHGEDETTFSFAAVMTKNNCDPLTIGEYFRSNFDPNVSVSCSYVTAMGGISADENFLAVAFDEKSLNEMSSNVLKAIDMGVEANLPNTIKRDALDGLMKIAHQECSGQIGSRCETDSPYHLIVKLDGDVLQCQNNNAHGEFGNISDMDSVSISGTKMWNHRATCQKCPIVHFCYGACPALDGNGFVDSCSVNWAYYSAMFTWVISTIFEDRLISIEGEVLRPVRELVETKHGKTKLLKKILMPSY